MFRSPNRINASIQMKHHSETGSGERSNQKAEKAPFRKYEIRSQSNKWADGEKWKLKSILPAPIPRFLLRLMYTQFMIRNHKFLFSFRNSSRRHFCCFLSTGDVERKTFSIFIQECF
jgi:hypothetical protein